MNTESVKQRVRDFLAARLGGKTFADADDIFDLGYVNSLFAVQLLRFVEQEFAVELGPDDLEFDNFRSVDRIAELVDHKLVEVA